MEPGAVLDFMTFLLQMRVNTSKYGISTYTYNDSTVKTKLHSRKDICAFEYDWVLRE